MSKSDYAERSINSGVEIGINNQRVIPLIKNWCKHVVVTDLSAGMLAEMTGLPITLEISCPHTTIAWSGMQFEACANDFVVQACIGCKYHEEVSPNNLGVEILNTHHQRQDSAAAKSLADHQKKATLKAEADKLVGVEKASSGMTKLSVLSLVQQLDDEASQQETADKILEASRLRPDFFTSAAIDFMSLFVEKECGRSLLQSMIVLQGHGIKISDFTLENLNVLIEENVNPDEAAAIIAYLFSDEELPHQKDFLSKVLRNCYYLDPYSMLHRKENEYKNSVAIFIRLAKIDRKMFDEMINGQILIDDALLRININGLLADICKTAPELVKPHLPQIVKSLDLTDDVSGDSADYRIKQTLRSHYFTYPQETIEELNKQYPQLSELAQLEIIDFYERLLKDEETFSLFGGKYSLSITSDLLDKLLEKTVSGEIELKLADTLADIAKARPKLLADNFDSTFGYVIAVIQKKITFTWYLEELKSSAKPSVTFNPLVGKSYADISTEQMEIDRKIGSAKSMAKHLVALDPDNYNLQILVSIKNLDSKKDGILKCQLIDLLRDSVKDPVTLSRMLPDIYNFLFDLDSEEVREMGVRFAIHILENFPEVVTKNLLATLKIFLKDQSVGVRGRAIEAYGVVLRKYPEENDAECIQSVLNGLIDKFVFVQKAAAGISYQVFPFLNPVQKAVWEQYLLGQEDYYFKKEEYDYCEKLIDRLLFFTKVEPQMYKFIVTKVLIKYVGIKEYYVVIKFLKKLSNVARQDPQFEDTWMKCALTFLTHTGPARMGPDPSERVELINQFYRTKPIVLVKNMKLFQAYARTRVDKFYYRHIIDCFGILAFFGLWNDLKMLISYCESKIERNASNAYVNNLVDVIKRFSAIETSVASKTLSITEIQKLIK
jgi:hypothetical protein